MPTNKKYAWLRHPVTVLVFGSFLSATVIPWISARMNDRQLINDARLQLCKDILQKSIQSDQMINSMNTSVNMFLKAQSFARSAAMAEREQEAERSKIDEQYHEFDKMAWWWYPSLPTEAKLLRIEVKSPREVADLLDLYHKELEAATEVLNGIWDRCVRQTCKASDPAIQDMLHEANGKLRTLQTERYTVTGKLVLLFAPRVPKVQQLLTQSE
jgi:hypothetical protein